MYQGRKATFAITLAVLMLTIIPVFTQFSPIHTVAATKASTTIINLRDMG